MFLLQKRDTFQFPISIPLKNKYSEIKSSITSLNGKRICLIRLTLSSSSSSDPSSPDHSFHWFILNTEQIYDSFFDDIDDADSLCYDLSNRNDNQIGVDGRRISSNRQGAMDALNSVSLNSF